MTDTKHSDAVYALNSYVWKLLQANLGWTTAQYGNRRPIVPAAQQPEFLQYEYPFVVYGSAMDKFETEPYINSETVAYTIYGKNANEVNQVMRVLAEALKWMDESANNVNAWLHREGQTRQGGKRPTSFLTIRVLQAASAGSPISEGGRVDAQVVVRVKYIDHATMKVKVSDFLP